MHIHRRSKECWRKTMTSSIVDTQKQNENEALYSWIGRPLMKIERERKRKKKKGHREERRTKKPARAMRKEKRVEWRGQSKSARNGEKGPISDQTPTPLHCG